MTAGALDPLIDVPARPQIMATLAALPAGDQLTSEKTGSGPALQTSVALTLRGRAAFELYTAWLRELLNGL